MVNTGGDAHCDALQNERVAMERCLADFFERRKSLDGRARLPRIPNGRSDEFKTY